MLKPIWQQFVDADDAALKFYFDHIHCDGAEPYGSPAWQARYAEYNAMANRADDLYRLYRDCR